MERRECWLPRITHVETIQIPWNNNPAVNNIGRVVNAWIQQNPQYWVVDIRQVDATIQTVILLCTDNPYSGGGA